MFSLEVPIRYNWMFILIFIKVFICPPQGTKQFYLPPRRLCFLLRDVCVGVSEVTEEAGTDSFICFVFPHSPEARAPLVILVSKCRLVLCFCWLAGLFLTGLFYAKGFRSHLALTIPFSNPGV